MAQNPTRVETTTKTVIKQTHAFLMASTRIWDSAHELIPIDGPDANKHKDGDDVHTYAELSFREDSEGVPGGDPDWGDIGGTLSDQTDLQTVLTNLDNGLQGVQALAGATSEGLTTEATTRANADSALSTALGGKADAVPTYIALLTQIGTGAPSATVIVNTLGGTVVWTRDDVGRYYGTLAGTFTVNKTVGIADCKKGGTSHVTYAEAPDAIRLETYNIGNLDLLDDQLDSNFIEIKVYP